MLEKIIHIFKILFGWFIVVIQFPVLSLFYFYKQCVVLIARIQGLIITESNVAFTTIDQVALNDHVEEDYELKPLCNIGIYADLGEGSIDLNELIEKIQTGLIDKERRTGYKLKSYWVRFGGYTFFKVNPDFKTSDHVHKVQLEHGADILKFMNNWIREPYTPKTGMWRVLVVNTGVTEYLAIKLHHGVGDALTLHEFINPIFENQCHPEVQKFLKNPSSKYSSILKLVSGFLIRIRPYKLNLLILDTI